MYSAICEYMCVYNICNIDDLTFFHKADAVGTSVERRPPVWENGSLIPGRFKPKTNKIDIYHFPACQLALIG